MKKVNNRRKFIKSTGLLSLGILSPNINFSQEEPLLQENNIHVFGKREGFTDQISLLVSMMDWMRFVVLRSVKGMSQKDLDFLLDDTSNTVGGMLMHLAATERYYQIHTFDGRSWGDFDAKDKDLWDVGSRLGETARKEIKGNSLAYYTDKLEAVREKTKEELSKREDSWLMESTNFFADQPTNNYCKWFHVVEHESNHNGQIKLLKSRMS